jgi:hypothetical protein
VEASNINGTANLTPLVGGLIADSWAGRFWTITFGSVIYQIGMVFLRRAPLAPPGALRPGRRLLPARVVLRPARRALPVAALHVHRHRRHPTLHHGLRCRPARAGRARRATGRKAQVELLQSLLLRHRAREAHSRDCRGVCPGERGVGVGAWNPNNHHARGGDRICVRVLAVRPNSAGRESIGPVGAGHHCSVQEEESRRAGP